MGLTIKIEIILIVNLSGDPPDALRVNFVEFEGEPPISASGRV